MDEFEEIKVWLNNVLGYPQYIEAFKANGYDRWNILMRLKSHNLFQIKSIKIGHVIRIINELKHINIAKLGTIRRQKQKQVSFKQRMNISIRSMLHSLAFIVNEYEYKMKKRANLGKIIDNDQAIAYFQQILSSSDSMMREIICHRDDFQSKLNQISSIFRVKSKQKTITNKITAPDPIKCSYEKSLSLIKIDDCAFTRKKKSNMNDELKKVVLKKKIISIILSYLDDDDDTALNDTAKHTEKRWEAEQGHIFDDFFCASGKILSLIMEYAIDTKRNEQNIEKAEKERDVQTLNKFVEMRECIVKLLLLHQSKMTKIANIQNALKEFRVSKNSEYMDSEAISQQQQNVEIISNLRGDYHMLSSKMYQAIHMIKFYDSYNCKNQ